MRQHIEGAEPCRCARPSADAGAGHQADVDAATMLKSFPTGGGMPLQFEAPLSTALYERLQ